MRFVPALLALLAAGVLIGCGDDEDDGATTTDTGTSDVAEAALEPTAVEASVGTITVTPIGGFGWQAQLETPQGTRVVAGNDPG